MIVRTPVLDLVHVQSARSLTHSLPAISLPPRPPATSAKKVEAERVEAAQFIDDDIDDIYLNISFWMLLSI